MKTFLLQKVVPLVCSNRIRLFSIWTPIVTGVIILVPSRDVARLLKSSFQDIGIKRHELLVKLKILKSMEEEIIRQNGRTGL